MNASDMAGLREGDLVRHRGTGQAFVVVRGWDGQRAVATRTLDVTNPDEWQLVDLADHVARQVAQVPPPKPRRWAMKAKLLLVLAALVTGLAFVAGAFVLIDALAHRDGLGILAGGGCCLATAWLIWNGGLPVGAGR